jgi:hypothetical protein
MKRSDAGLERWMERWEIERNKSEVIGDTYIYCKSLADINGYKLQDCEIIYKI